jgi:hypothetical protein
MTQAHSIRLVVAAFAVAVLSPVSAFAQAPAKPRVVITQDPELDDVNTVIRAVLYNNDFKLEGLVYASATIHWKGDGKGTTQYNAGRGQQTSHRWPTGDDRWIDAIVDGYAKVYANLRVHNPGYMTPAELKSKVKWGNVEFAGDYSKDTDGSNLIKSLLLDSVPGPLFVTAGGGQSTIARALKSIYDQYAKTPQWASIKEKVSKKLVIIPWGDQDGVNGRYIRPNWPAVQTWTLAMISFGYGAARSHTPENQVLLGSAWTHENISSRGVLGAMYRVWGDGKNMAQGDVEDYFGFSGLTAEQLTAMGYRVWTPPGEKGSFISEGDTPTFMNLLDNGLRAHQGDGSWGGWGAGATWRVVVVEVARRLRRLRMIQALLLVSLRREASRIFHFPLRPSPLLPPRALLGAGRAAAPAGRPQQKVRVALAVAVAPPTGR